MSPKVTSGRDIQQRAFAFACRMVELVRELGGQGGVARLLCPQILHCGTSVGANLEEAVAGHSKPDFIAKCSIALKEARETLCWLRLLRACQIVSTSRLTHLASEADQLIAILTTIVRNARASPNRG